MEVENLKGSETGFIGGALAIVLLGILLTTANPNPLEGIYKAGKALYNIGLAAIAFAFIGEAFSEGSDLKKGAFAVAGALTLLAMAL